MPTRPCGPSGSSAPRPSPDDDPTRDPADPCAKPEVLYAFPQLVYLYTVKVWTFALALLAPKQPYRAIGGIHVRAGSERVRMLENVIVGGGGNGITLGGDLEPADVPPATRLTSRLTLADVAGLKRVCGFRGAAGRGSTPDTSPARERPRLERICGRGLRRLPASRESSSSKGWT